MKDIINVLETHGSVSDYKINMHSLESCQLFFVKGRLETFRRTDNCDRQVTVYVDHGSVRGEAQFFVYPSTTVEELHRLTDEAVGQALLIHNKRYQLPPAQLGEYTADSNFADYDAAEAAEMIAREIFAANDVEGACLNSVEIFVERHRDTVANSRGLCKTQLRYSATVEAIPTYNGREQSVELYQQFSLDSLDKEHIRSEIREKLQEVKARYEAKKPEKELAGAVILEKNELAELTWNIASQLNYSSVYCATGVFRKDDMVQLERRNDAVNIRQCGSIPGCLRSSFFDADGLSLGSRELVSQGKVVDYFGSNRYGQYLAVEPSGLLPCTELGCGSATAEDFAIEPRLEVKSMSALQVDFYNNYIGGEVRLGYWYENGECTPVTGLSIAANISNVLADIRLSSASAVTENYKGPDRAILSGVKIY